MITIRAVEPEKDYPRMGEILSKAYDEKVTSETLHEWFDERQPNQVVRDFVAEDADGKMVGCIYVEHENYDHEGWYRLFVGVDEPYRQQGIGSQLYDYALSVAKSEGATTLYVTVQENYPPALEFAQKRGFTIRRHMFSSKLDLKTFDDTPYLGLIEKLQSEGVRFFSLADEGDTIEARRKLHKVNYDCVMDDPASTGSFLEFDEFNDMFNKSSWFVPEGQMLAAIGDEYIALSALGYFKELNCMYNNMTGVMPVYRGRGIALALKVKALQFAKAFGVNYVETHNDSTNIPMLKINQKLGYVPKSGEFRMIKHLQA